MRKLSPLHVDVAPASARSSLKMVLRAFLALGLLGAAIGTSVTACGGGAEGTTSTSTGTGGSGATSSSTGPGECKGGVIVDGVCQGKCTPDKCLPGNTCVGNACELKCTKHTDCESGTQDCLPAKEDDTMADITVCTNTGHAAVGTSCPFNNECGVIGACPDGKSCDIPQCGGAVCTVNPAACGNDPFCRAGSCPDMSACTAPECADGSTCTKDDKQCGTDANCVKGLCANSSVCTVKPAPVINCPADQCKPLKCQTNGVGDALAYCTKLDCTDDTQCPGGYSCGITRDPHLICGLMPAKGNSTECGKTSEPCVDPATFGMNGNTFFEGSICLMRKECLRNDRCFTCKTDSDCTIQGQTCVKSGAANHCLRTCLKTSDCPDGTGCVSGSCQPVYTGGCEGKGEFCAPCLNDEDCGKKGTSMACQVVNDLTDERGCFDTSFPTACMTDVDCPLSPGNRHGRCLSEADGVNPGDTVYHKCYLPFKIDGFTCGK